MRACNCARASPFQSRTCEGCDRCHPVCCRLCDEVSIHAPAWGATRNADSRTQRHQSFNPRTRVGCDDLCGKGDTDRTGFNPRTRVGCDTYYSGRMVAIIEFQSTHPRGVRHTFYSDLRQKYIVSIHAPAWGATMWGRTLAVRSMRFNPRTRVGCDAVLTHETASLDSFNPRTRVGCDVSIAVAGIMRTMFQSTHPRGVRQLVRQPVRLPAQFQSTHPRGVRHILRRQTQMPYNVSIHAPAWGATVSMFYPVDSRD